MFIAPRVNEYKTVSPSQATALLRSYDANILRDGRLRCADGYITCELPTLTKAEEAAARMLRHVHDEYMIYVRERQQLAMTECIDMDKVPHSPKYTKAMGEYDGVEMVLEAMYRQSPLRLAAIKAASGVTY